MVTVLRLTASTTALLAILAAAPAPTPVEQVAPEAAMSIMGVTVQGPAGKDIGRLTDVLVGLDGRPVAAVIDFGGFLGVGNRKVAVDWKSLKFSPGDKTHPITLELAPDQVRAAPDYKDQQPAPVVKPDLVKSEAAKSELPKPAVPQPARAAAARGPVTRPAAGGGQAGGDQTGDGQAGGDDPAERTPAERTTAGLDKVGCEPARRAPTGRDPAGCEQAGRGETGRRQA